MGVVVFCQIIKHYFDRRQVEFCIREQTALYRHYCLPEVQRVVKQCTNVDVTRSEAIAIVQKIRDEKELGPIADYNL
jgi:hypothetical protein